MRKRPGARGARMAMGVLLAAATAGCSDPGAEKKAAAEAQAKADTAAKAEKLQTLVDFDSNCLAALRWQAAALAGAGIGALDVYADYFRGDLETALGDQTIAAAPPKPGISRATIDPYLEWSYAEGVKTKFGGRGPEVISACVQQVAEAGKGGLAGPDKVARMYRMRALRAKLKAGGA